jgi:hypothetical protein
MDDQLNPFRIDGEVKRKTPGQVIRMYLDGASGALGGAIRAPYVAAKAIDDVVDVVKGNDLEDDVAVTRGLKYLDDAANVVTPDNELGRLSDEFIGQNLTLTGAARAVAKPGIRAMTDTAQFVGAPIAGQAAIDAGANPTAALIAETAVGAAPMNFGSHRNRNDIFVGPGISRHTDLGGQAGEAMDGALKLYKETGGPRPSSVGLSPEQAFKIRENYRRKTGAFVGPDGMPRAEVQDQDIAEGFMNMKHKLPSEFPLAELPGADALRQITSAVDYVNVDQRAAKKDSMGFYSPSRMTIGLNPKYPDGKVKTFVHELQHAMQHFTNLPSGGTPEGASIYKPQDIKDTLEIMRNGNIERIKKTGSGMKYKVRHEYPDGQRKDPSSYAKAQNDEFERLLESMATTYGGRSIDRYAKMMGEAESRLTEDRLFMSPKERLETPIKYTNRYDNDKGINPRTLTVTKKEYEDIIQPFGQYRSSWSDIKQGIPGNYLANDPKDPKGLLKRAPRRGDIQWPSTISGRDLDDETMIRLGYLYDNGYFE